MKKLTIVLGSIMLLAAVAYPVFAQGPGWGRGHHMWGYGSGGPGYCWGYGPGQKDWTPEQLEKTDQLRQTFRDETRDLRGQIWEKSAEMERLMDSAEPDVDKLKALQKEVSNLRAKMAEKRMDFQLELRKIAPEETYAGGYGRGTKRGYGKGYGRGYGHGRGAYGQGGCWQ